MRILALVLLPLPAIAASFCLTAVPEPLKSSALSLGTGKDYGIWQLAISQTTGPVSRTSIMERLPFAALYEWQAADILNRSAASDHRTVLSAYFVSLKDIGPAGLVYAGTRTSNLYAKGALMAAGGVWALAVGRTSAKVPNPDQTKSHLLPDEGVTGDWNGLIVTGIVRSAGKIGPLCGLPTTLTGFTGSSTASPFAIPTFDRTELEYMHSPAWYLARILESRRELGYEPIE